MKWLIILLVYALFQLLLLVELEKEKKAVHNELLMHQTYQPIHL